MMITTHKTFPTRSMAILKSVWTEKQKTRKQVLQERFLELRHPSLTFQPTGPTFRDNMVFTQRLNVLKWRGGADDLSARRTRRNQALSITPPVQSIRTVTY
eukprot:627142-Rhodomonas_salina.1